MRTISEIVVHHSYTTRDQDLDKSIKSFNDTHYKRLHLPYNQPLSGIEGSLHVAYHYVIAGNGDYQKTRNHEVMGYHASNIEVNKRSIGICLTGNFDNENPTPAQLNSLKEIVNELKRTYTISKISGHRSYASKSCPGKNFTNQMIQSLLNSGQELAPWEREAIRWAKRNKVSNGQRPRDPITRVEAMRMLQQYHTSFHSK